ncbi:hypothetical protein GCM10028827_40480 [Mucilaginibacter myungsuensis]
MIYGFKTIAQINVSEISYAIRVERGYATTEQDYILVHNGFRYLVKNRQTYNKNNLDSVYVWKPEGYIQYSSKDLAKDKQLLSFYRINQTVKLTFITNGWIRINTSAFNIGHHDRIKKILYYSDERNKEHLYRLRYN